ncbi:MAG: hypothetical protein HFI40_07580 [Lachnospiraceae bacterium]|jgi:hypothetical protein|nr:hypothetical protein [Lachnospiraceae bacterium]MCX4316472.1 hypothetical protein [Lachnospiraceae bacterium]
MKVIKNSMIEGKEAKLLLLSNNQTLKISLGNKVICMIEDLWDDIKEEEWAQLGILKIEAESYIKKKKADAKLKAIAEEFF